MYRSASSLHAAVYHTVSYVTSTSPWLPRGWLSEVKVLSWSADGHARASEGSRQPEDLLLTKRFWVSTQRYKVRLSGSSVVARYRGLDGTWVVKDLCIGQTVMVYVIMTYAWYHYLDGWTGSSRVVPVTWHLECLWSVHPSLTLCQDWMNEAGFLLSVLWSKDCSLFLQCGTLHDFY